MHEQRHRRRAANRSDDRSSTGTAEMKAVAEELMQLGTRCLQAGKQWFDQRRHDMAHRFDEDDHESRGVAGEQPRSATPRWDEETGYGPSRHRGTQDYGAQDYERQRDERYQRNPRAGGAVTGGARYGSERWDRDEYEDVHGYRQGLEAAEREYFGTQRDHGREYGRDYGYGSSAGGARNEHVQGERSWADQPWRSGASPEPGERYGAQQSGGRQYGFRGRGPKNYTRSDERITEDVNERLMDADDIDASEVSVRVKDGVVTLEGSVEQRWMKHRIEDIAEACSGVRDVENRVRVARDTSASGRVAGSATGDVSRAGATSAGTARGAAGTTESEQGTTGTTAH